MFKTLSVIFFFLGSTLSAQSIKVEGTIKDSIGNPLEFANVIVSIKSSGATETYGITNHEGRFKLNLPKGNTYILRASFLGYETEEQIVNVPVDTENIELDFILKPQENRLDDVEIVYEMPVTVKRYYCLQRRQFHHWRRAKIGRCNEKAPWRCGE